MCGLFGIINLDKTRAPLSRAMLERGLKTLGHRGPDENGIFINQKKDVGLAHARLSIIDLNDGKQPLQTKDGAITAIVNGEFYNFEKIRADLMKKGHVFSTKSDSEIILHLYREYGMAFLDHLRGEFAFILYDAKRHKIIAGRDRFGIKPLLYKWDKKQNRLYIASEAKAILSQAGIEAHWDMPAFYQATQMQYLPGNKTIFKDISQLEPGQLLTLSQGEEPSLSTYWDMDYPRSDQARETPSFNEAVSHTHDLLKEAVTLRLRADVPVSCHLSGGIDSSAIAGLAAKQSNKPLDCFTVRFDDPDQQGYDEYEIAKEQADLIGANLHAVRVSARNIVDNIDAAVYKTEGLSINGHLAGKYCLSKAIREAGFKVTLSGEGSDEIFFGYPHFKQDLDINGIHDGNEKLKGVFLSHGEELNTKAVYEALGFVPAFLKAKASLGFRLNSLLRPVFQARYARDSYADLMAFYQDRAQLQGRHNVEQASYLWSKMTLAGYILKTLGDGCEMAHSLEGRVPFLDHKLFDYVRDLPVSFKMSQGPDGRIREKYILRETMKPYITKRLYAREKHPFIAPPAGAGEKSGNPYLFEKLGNLITSQSFKNQPFWDPAKTMTWFEGLRGADSQTRITQEPVVMMLLTSLSAARQFNLTDGGDNESGK